MRTVYSFNEAYCGVREANSGDGRIVSFNFDTNSDLPAETTPDSGSDETDSGNDLYNLCYDVTDLLGVLSSAVKGLNETYHTLNREDQQNRRRGTVTHKFVPYKDGTEEFDFTRVGDTSGGTENGQLLDTFYLDYVNLINGFRSGMNIANSDKRLYNELVQKTKQLRQKIIDEYKNVQKLYSEGKFGGADSTVIKRRVSYIRPINEVQKVLLESELAQPFYFGENAFVPVDPLDYVDEKLVTSAFKNALKNGLEKALAMSAQRDAEYLAEMKRMS